MWLEGLGKVGRVKEGFGFFLDKRNGEARRLFEHKSFATEKEAVQWLEARGTWGKGKQGEDGVWIFVYKNVSSNGSRVVVKKIGGTV
jgi:hypothetical protein